MPNSAPIRARDDPLTSDGSRTGPVIAWLLILALIFGAEYGVMLLLGMLPRHPPRWLESAADAVVLTLLIAPVLWWMVVRPLRQSIQLRSHFLERLLEGIEAERRRLAHELHDGIGQSLTLLVSGLRSMRTETARDDVSGHVSGHVSGRCEDLERLARTALADAKKLSLGLRPSLLDDLGLAPAIERVVADVREHHPLEVDLDVDALLGRRLPEAVETALFRIFQEAMSNIMKHSGARQAVVRLERNNGIVTLEISDDGCGMAPRPLNQAPDGHLGLVSIRERAALIGGELLIDTVPGRGTRIVARVPERSVA